MRCSVLHLSVVVSVSLLAGACSDDGGVNTAPMNTTVDTMTSSGSGVETDSPTSDPTEDPTNDPTDDPTNDPTEDIPDTCGNGVVDDGEECDNGAENADNAACTSACKKATCGDGLVHEGVEECDDGNVDNGDTCVAGCKLASCGDGFVGPGEACDDGNDINDDECNNECALGTCGNGQIDIGEECDDGNDNNTDACLNTCLNAICGDGVVWPGGGEECDDGNQIDDDACTNECLLNEPGDDCQDNQQNGDETDVDCGGSCKPCDDGKVCKANPDCASGNCDNGTCQPDDGVELMPPNCGDAMVNAAQVWNDVVSKKCGCHGGGSGGLTMNSEDTLKTNTVNVKATNAAMNRITPGDINNSYLLYKILNQHNKVAGGGGSQMPQGGPLPDNEKCLIINWVKSI